MDKSKLEQAAQEMGISFIDAGDCGYFVMGMPESSAILAIAIFSNEGKLLNIRGALADREDERLAAAAASVKRFMDKLYQGPFYHSSVGYCLDRKAVARAQQYLDEEMYGPAIAQVISLALS